MSRRKLTPKQQRFVEEYLTDLNATQAAIRAGYSEKGANVRGSYLLANVNIANAIAKAKQDLSERTGITQERILMELSRIGFSDLRNVLTPGGNLLDPRDWDDDTAAAISSFEVVTNSNGEKDKDGRKAIEYTHKIRVWDKNSALEKMGKHLGMFPSRHEHSGPDGGPIEVQSPAQKLKDQMDVVSERIRKDG